MCFLYALVCTNHISHTTTLWCERRRERTKELKRVVPEPGHGPLQPWFWIIGTTKRANLFSVPGSSKDSTGVVLSFISRWFLRAKAKAARQTFDARACPDLCRSKRTDALTETVNPSSLTPNPITWGTHEICTINVSHCGPPPGGTRLWDAVPRTSSPALTVQPCEGAEREPQPVKRKSDYATPRYRRCVEVTHAKLKSYSAMNGTHGKWLPSGSHEH